MYEETRKTTNLSLKTAAGHNDARGQLNRLDIRQDNAA